MELSYFQPLLDAAEFLGEEQTRNALLRMQSVYQQKQYFVAFIGQYSAGKSCLINSLLRRKLLPEGTTETTPLLTYIRYGAREEAKLHYMDGAVQILNLAQAAGVAQQAGDGEWDLERLEYLEIFVREELLSSGMILLDTPGVNTLIERHERLLETSLSISSGIVYVAGHAPSLVDVEKLSILTKAGFDVAFVRTHCDEIKEREETLDQVKAADQSVLASCGIGPKQCFYVSNQEGSPLYAALDPVRKLLVEKGSRAGEELEHSMERQLAVLAERYKAALESHRTLLEQARAKDTEELECRRAKLLQRIKSLESRLEENRTALRRRVDTCRRTLEGDVRHQLEGGIRHSRDRIESSEAISDEAEMTDLLRREAAAFSRNAYQLLNAALDPLVQEINGDFDAEDMGLSYAALPQAENYLSLRTEQDEQTELLRTRLTALREHQEELTRTLTAKMGSEEYLQLQKEVVELESTLVEAQQERDDLPPYVPQMVVQEDGEMQPSQIMRSIGSKLDWLMLLIPGAQVEAALGKLAKAPKVAKTLGKAVGVLEKAGGLVKKGDSIKDVLFTLKNIADHTRSSKRRVEIADKAVGKVAQGIGTGIDALHSAQKSENRSSILDLLTVEHWAGKLGEQFDRPPRLVVDEEYETQYRQEKERVEANLRHAQQKAYQKKLEMGLLQEKAERLRAQEESLRVDQKTVAQELAKRESELRIAAVREARRKWRQECGKWYQSEMEQSLRDAISAYTESFPARLEEYQQQRLQALQKTLERERTSYDGLANASENEITAELRQVNELLEKIEGILHG